MATSLVNLLPEDLRLAPGAIPPEQNAWEPLQEAGRRFVGRSEDLPRYWPPDDPRNEGFTGTEADVRALLAANEPAIAALDEALARGVVQVANPQTSWDLEFSSALMFCRLLSLRSSLSLCEGQQRAAGEDVLRLLRLGWLLVSNSNCGNATTGQLLLTWAATSMRSVVDSSSVARETLDGLLVQVRACGGLRQRLADALKQRLWHWSLPFVQVLREQPPDDRSAMLDALVELIAGKDDSEPDLSDDECVLDGSRQAARREVLRSCLGYMLRGHPHPYDERLTVDWFAADTLWGMRRVQQLGATPWYRLRDTWDEWCHAWNRRSMRKTLDAWPGWIFRFMHPMDFTFPDEVSFPCSDDWYASLFEPINEATLEMARQRVQRIVNPVGALVFHALAGGQFDGIVRYTEGALGVSELVIALRIHELEHGRLPRRLRDLVRGGILDRLPVDPFTGRAFSYNAKTGTVWSAGDADDPSYRERKPNDACARRLAWQLAGHRTDATLGATDAES